MNENEDNPSRILCAVFSSFGFLGSEGDREPLCRSDAEDLLFVWSGLFDSNAGVLTGGRGVEGVKTEIVGDEKMISENG